MSVVRPFRGLRPKSEFAAQVACPPYDVLNAVEARAMADGNPYSFLRVNKAELEFDDSVNPYSSQVYERAASNLQKLIKTGVMVRDAAPCFYLYRLTMSGRSQTGLVALTSVEEYNQGKIKKHELTRPEKVNDRATHIMTLNAQVGPVFSTFRHDAEIAGLFRSIQQAPPLIDFESNDGIRHEFWVADVSATVKRLETAFRRLPSLYIADGHHRSEAASEVAHRIQAQRLEAEAKRPYGYFLNVLFSDNELQILPYNRVVKDLNGLTFEEILSRANSNFDVKPVDGELSPEKHRQFGLYCDHRWYQLTARDGTFDTVHPTRSIDASVLSDNLLAPILGIMNLRTDKRIDFVGGIRGTGELVRLVDSGEYKMAFSLYPTSIDQLLTVADAGEVMPPKSTWFEPKLRDGLVVYQLTD